MNCEVSYHSDNPVSACTLTNTYSIFITLIFVLVFLWVIASFWVIFLDLFFYKTVDFDVTSTTDTFCVAMCITIFFVILTYLIKYSGIVPNLEQRLLGVGSTEKSREMKVKGPNYSKFVDISDSLELQGGGIVSDDVINSLRAARLARGTV